MGVVKGCRHLLSTTLLLHKLSATVGAQLGGLWWKEKKQTSRSSFFHVAFPSCLLSSFAIPLLAVILSFVWPGCKQD